MEPVPKNVAVRLLVYTVICSSLVVSCGDYAIDLPGGHSLVRIYGGTFIISHPDHRGIAVTATVDGYKVYGTIVVGHVSMADLEPEKSYSKPGYFILNTETHAVADGLSKEAYLDALRKQGIKTEPALITPSRFQSWF